MIRWLTAGVATAALASVGWYHVLRPGMAWTFPPAATAAVAALLGVSTTVLLGAGLALALLASYRTAAGLASKDMPPVERGGWR